MSPLLSLLLLGLCAHSLADRCWTVQRDKHMLQGKPVGHVPNTAQCSRRCVKREKSEHFDWNPAHEDTCWCHKAASTLMPMSGIDHYNVVDNCCWSRWKKGPFKALSRGGIEVTWPTNNFECRAACVADERGCTGVEFVGSGSCWLIIKGAKADKSKRDDPPKKSQQSDKKPKNCKRKSG